jgi:hypothetical protein
MLTNRAITNIANSAYPKFLHKGLLVPLVAIVKLANIEICHAKSTLSRPNLSPRFSHITNIGLQLANRLEQPEYSNVNATKYAQHSPAALHCVPCLTCSSAVMRNETTSPPINMAKPKVKVESFYIPLFQLLTMVFGFAAALQLSRNTTVRLCLIVLFVVAAIASISLIVYASTGISQHFLSTVNFTLPLPLRFYSTCYLG